MAEYSDNFDRTDGPTLGANWTQITGTDAQLRIVGNAAQLGATYWMGGDYWSANTFANDQYAEVKIPAIVAPSSNSNCGPAVRISTSAKTFYGMYINAVDDGDGAIAEIDAALVYVNGASIVQVGTTANLGTSLPDTILRLEIIGTTLTLKTATAHGGTFTTRVSGTNSALASGRSGIACAYNTTISLDNWYGGDITSDVTQAVTGLVGTQTPGSLGPSFVKVI